ncbi:hypothetical protein [Spirosoma pollinicola]|uniref:DUF5683 domain-containing protein n=1 Tax=Spirosoma pollinicola TaxID=2057025 RepID=A0A2K8Z5P1_9BACT|nr:hypothetical protein [Spirosoma pollinicola]AUD05144.1 hypothetical protein CWM47_26840 [Spirosoma pollinicola]
MRTVLLLILLLVICQLANAQRQRDDDTSHYRSVPIPAHLLPIERAYGSSSLGSVYFYGGKKLSSPYSLEVPFYELNDPDVSHRFQTFRTVTTLSRLTALVPLAYILLSSNRTGGTYWTVYGGSIAASLTLSIIGNAQINKAVTRYNQLLRQPRVGISFSPVPLTGQLAAGVGVSWGFNYK